MSRTYIAITGKPKVETATTPVVNTPAKPVAVKPLRVAEPVDEIPFIEVGGPRQKPVAALVKPAPVVAKPVAVPQPATPTPNIVRAHFSQPQIVPMQRATAPQHIQQPPALQVMKVAFQAMPELRMFGHGGSRMADELISFHQPQHPVSQQYRQLQQAMAQQLPKQDRAVLVLTAVGAGHELKTTALNIAVSRALDQRGRVLLIDGDPTSTSLAVSLGCADQPGLSELLHQQVPIGLGIQATELANLHVMPWGQATQPLTEAAWARLPMIMTRLMQRFEWVLINTPRHRAELSRWLSFTDGVYLVVRQEEWDSPHVDDAHDAIRQQGGHLRGCLMTAA
jgi:Mrp family chromosome partitioning ATPase